MPDKQFSENIANRFDGFGSAPSDAVWTGIESQLVKDERKRRFIIWWFTGVLALGVISAVFFFTTHTDIASERQFSEVSKENLSTENSTDRSNEQLKNQTNIIHSPLNQEALDDHSSLVKQSITNQSTTQLNSDYSDAKSVTNKSRVESSLTSKKPINENILTSTSGSNSSRGNAHVVLMNNNDRTDRTELPVSSTVNINRLPLLNLQLNQPSSPERTEAYFIEEKNNPNKWLLGFSVSQFITVSPRLENSPIPSPPSPPSDPGSLADLSETNYTEYNNERKFEAELFIQRQFRNRLNITSGITGSFMRRSYTIYSDAIASIAPTITSSSANKSYWNIGVPVKADYYFIDQQRFQFGSGISVLTEYGSVSNFNYTGTTSTFNGYENASAGVASKQRALQLSIQPYLRANYVTRNRWNFFLETGYRKNLFDSSESSKYTLPGYITFTGGLTWKL